MPQYRPVIDGYFLPLTPEELILSGHMNAERFMTGATMDEGLIAGMCNKKYLKQKDIQQLLNIETI